MNLLIIDTILILTRYKVQKMYEDSSRSDLQISQHEFDNLYHSILPVKASFKILYTKKINLL